VGIIALSVSGIVLTVFASVCSNAHAHNSKDVKLLGRIHWGIIGALGYLSCIVFARNTLALQVLAVGTTLTTLWLIRKYVKVRLGCPFCPLVWALNTMIVAAVVFR
jgi:hypothetical protein